MKKSPASQSAIFIPRLLLVFTLCSGGLFLAMLSFAATDEEPYRRPGITERVSVASDGTQGNGESDLFAGPTISSDGRYVAFATNASNLVPADTNGRDDVFVHDRTTGVTERVSVASDGTQANSFSYWAVISADGQHVAFYSNASNLVPGDTNEFYDVFVHDRATGATERVSVASDGAQANFFSYRPAISGDGRYVAFDSTASNLVPGDNRGAPDVFVHDRVTGTTERVSVAPGGAEANGSSYQPSISADGRYVAIYSTAFNLVPGDTNGSAEVFVYDRVTDATERVSVASDGAQANSFSYQPAISSDGRYVAFDSTASNLVPADTNGFGDVFVHDRVTGATERVSVTSDGAEVHTWTGYTPVISEPVISADGRYVTFYSYASDMVAGDINGVWDVFVHDRATRETERISLAPGGTESNFNSYTPDISADGRYIAFMSGASNLVPGDTNERPDMFVRDRGLAVGIGPLSASCDSGSITVSGWATFSGAVIASAEDSAQDAVSGAAAAGGELTGASLAYRPENGDLMVRLRLASLPPTVGGAPGVLYGLEFTAGTGNYEVRAQRLEGTTGAPYFGLYRCELTCTQVALLAGSMGTTGLEILVSVPLTTLGAAEGVSLTMVRAYTAFGDATTGPGVPLDEVALPATIVPLHSVSLGIAPAGTPEAQVAFDTPATLAGGNFSRTLDLSSGNYDVWARACLGATCGPAVSSPLPACSPTPTSAVSRKTHGTAGNFDVNLPLTGNPGIECRTGGAAANYRLIVTFPSAITCNNAQVTGGTGSVSNFSVNASGTNVTVNLTGVANAQTITVSLIGVNDGDKTGDVAVRMGVLLGDTTANRAVNSSDISQTKSKSGQIATSANFRQDVTVNGSVNSSDISLVKSKSGTGLP